MPDVLTEVRKRRGPFTRILIALVIAWMVLGVVRMVVAVVGGVGVLTAAGRHAGDLVSVPVLLVLLLFVVADVWVRPRLENAVRLARIGTWVGSIAVLASVVAGAVALWSPLLTVSDRALAVADLVISSVVPVLLCVALGTVAGAARRVAAPAPGAAEAASPEEVPGTTPPMAVSPGWPETASEERDLRPTWGVDEASGAAWSSAAEAGRGGEAVAWGDDTTPFGWQPDASGHEVAGPAGARDAASPDGPGHASTPGRTPGQIDPRLWQRSHDEGE